MPSVFYSIPLYFPSITSNITKEYLVFGKMYNLHVCKPTVMLVFVSVVLSSATKLTSSQRDEDDELFDGRIVL